MQTLYPGKRKVAWRTSESLLWTVEKHANALLKRVVTWCANEHAGGPDEYYRKLAATKCPGSRDRKILISKDEHARNSEQYYYTDEFDGWRLFCKLANAKKKRVLKVCVEACRKPDGSALAPGRDVEWIILDPKSKTAGSAGQD